MTEDVGRTERAGVALGSFPRHVGTDAARGTDAGGELARAHLARHARWRESAFAALNTAFLADGAFVHVPADVTLDRPLELVFLSTGRAVSDGPMVSHPRSLVVVERGARAAVVETYAALSDGVYWRNAVTEGVGGGGAAAELYRVQQEGPPSFQGGTTHSRHERDSY